MRYPPHILDEIRARLPVSQVVGQRVRLKKAGREWKGLSPFNAEKTPSFYVNDQKGFYHCFSSGKHGDIFSFLAEAEGLSFPEAVERLAAEAGVPLPKPSREERGEDQRRNGLYDVVEMAAEFFESRLQGRFGLGARDYLAGRGLDPEVQKRFRIGYAPPDRYGLRDHLAAKGVLAPLMAEAGLVVTGEDVKVPYDRFRDRVIFPITDARGRVVAFGGRAMSPAAPAKYLNSPETPLFHKGRLLYNLANARQPAHEKGSIIAVEGYVDAIAMSVAGFPHTVAPLGTALTEDQLTLLWRLADEPILCFDGDPAGRRAAFRALDLALPLLSSGKSLRFALLPEGQDPDDLARSGGADAIRRVLDQARPLVDMLWAREIEAGPLDTPERRAALEGRLRQAIAGIGDDVLKRHYREEIEARLGTISPDPRRARPFARRQGGPGERPKPHLTLVREVPKASPALAPILSAGQGKAPREALIVLLLAAHPALLDAYQHELAELEFSHPAVLKAASWLLDAAAIDEEERRGAASFDGLRSLLLPMIHASNRKYVEDADRVAEAEKLLRQAISLQKRRVSLRPELALAEAELARAESPEPLALVTHLKADMDSVEGIEADERDGADEARSIDTYLDNVLKQMGIEPRR